MRRTPAATGLSEMILKSPMSPVRRTCVPPQSSTEKCRAEVVLVSRSSPIATTRTSSPYFSRKSAHMHHEIARFPLGVRDREFRSSRREDRAGVAHLAAGLAVERRLVENQGGLDARLDVLDGLAVDHDRGDTALGRIGVVAEE